MRMSIATQMPMWKSTPKTTAARRGHVPASVSGANASSNTIVLTPITPQSHDQRSRRIHGTCPVSAHFAWRMPTTLLDSAHGVPTDTAFQSPGKK